MFKFVRASALGAFIAVSGIGLAIMPLGMKLEEDLGLDWLFAVRGEVDPPANIFIVSMDKDSKNFLRQPAQLREWNRLLHAELIDRLVQQGVSTIVFDIFFQRGRNPDEDQMLARSVALSERVVLVQKVERDNSGEIMIDKLVSPAGTIAAASIGVAPFPLPKIPNRVSQFWKFHSGAGDVPTLPVVSLQVHVLNAVGYGQFVDIIRQADIVTSHELPAAIKNSKDTNNLILGLRKAFKHDAAALQQYSTNIMENADLELTGVARRGLFALGHAYSTSASEFINFYGPPGTISTIPYRSLLSQESSFSALPNLENAIVFVGEVAESPTDQLDGFFTVFSTKGGLDLSGVEIAATALGNMLDDSAIRSLSMVSTIGTLCAFGMVAGILAFLIPGVKGALATCIFGASYFGMAQVFFAGQYMWWPVFIPVAIQLPIALLSGLFWHYVRARQVGEAMTQAMGYYVPKRIANQIAEKGSGLSTDPEVVYATCLCTDVADYTTLSEMVAPEELTQLGNEYFGILGDRVKNRGVEMIDFMGDGMTCVWSGTEPQQDTRLQACLAALEILEDVKGFNHRHPDLRYLTRIGLNAGRVALGNIGGGGHFSYSVTGDIVNTASRIEGLNKHLGTWLLAAEAVVHDLDSLLMRRVGRFVLKGKAEVLTVFEVIDRQGSAAIKQIDLCERFCTALELYDRQYWMEAGQNFEMILATFPEDGPSRFYQNICKAYSTNPNRATQDPVIRLDTK